MNSSTPREPSASGLLRQHLAHRRAGDQERTGQVRRQDGLPALQRRLVKRPVAVAAAADAGHGVHGVQATVALDAGGDGRDRPPPRAPGRRRPSRHRAPRRARWAWSAVSRGHEQPARPRRRAPGRPDAAIPVEPVTSTTRPSNRLTASPLQRPRARCARRASRSAPVSALPIADRHGAGLEEGGRVRGVDAPGRDELHVGHRAAQLSDEGRAHRGCGEELHERRPGRPGRGHLGGGHRAGHERQPGGERRLEHAGVEHGATPKSAPAASASSSCARREDGAGADDHRRVRSSRIAHGGQVVALPTARPS